MPYIIRASGGHLKEERFVHESGLLTGVKEAAERFNSFDAAESVKMNKKSSVTYETIFVIDEQTVFDNEKAFPELFKKKP